MQKNNLKLIAFIFFIFKTTRKQNEYKVFISKNLAYDFN